jgi:pimeloyl-ACP methyl ester carboxylesterase
MIRRLLFLAAISLVVRPLAAATVNGMKIHSTSTGKGSKTLMLVHGWTCDDTSWAANVPELAKHYRVITLDLPGHGKSGAPKDGNVTMEMFAKAVEAVRAERKVDKIILVGHSMGTPVIREYAHLYPQHVAALVLVDGVVVAPTPPGGRGIQMPLDADKLTTAEGLSMREGMIKGMFTPNTPKDVRENVLKMLLRRRRPPRARCARPSTRSTRATRSCSSRPTASSQRSRSRCPRRRSSRKSFRTSTTSRCPVPGTS